MTKAIEVAKDYKISGLYLRAHLASLRKVTGNQYPRLLEQAGLAQYITKYPLPDFNCAAKGSQFIELYTRIKEFLQPSLYDLFQKNIGREFARAVCTNRYITDRLPEIGAMSEPSNIIKMFGVLNTVNDKLIDQQIRVVTASDKISPLVLKKITEKGEKAVVVTFKNCLYCAFVDYSEGQAAGKPSCQTIVHYYKELFPQLSSLAGFPRLRFQVEEIFCAAQQGSPHTDCFFAVQCGG